MEKDRFICYVLEPWHADICEFVELKKITVMKMLELVICSMLYIPDIFMKKVQKNEEVFNVRMNVPDYVKHAGINLMNYIINMLKKVNIKNQCLLELVANILKAQSETGIPYLVYKDAVNNKSNQKNRTIRSSNLCTEIAEYSDDKEYACCTLGSIGLPMYVEDLTKSQIEDILNNESVVMYGKPDCIYCTQAKNLLKRLQIEYDYIQISPEIKEEHSVLRNCKTVPQIFIGERHVGGFTELEKLFRPRINYEKLMEVTSVLTRNLDKVIDLNYYPVPETERSNKRHRPLGIGVQGLADVFIKCRVPFDSEDAAEINRKLFACIYYSAMSQSVKMSQEMGPYSTYEGSPISKGNFNLMRE